jgi:GNAT superfamily N-acetyltransferase
MDIQTVAANTDNLRRYGQIDIAFEVRGVMRAPTAGDRSVLLDQPIEKPYIKDYDAIPGEAPPSWPDRFDMASWLLMLATDDAGRLVGGAALVCDHIEGLTRSPDDAVLWDIRVLPGERRRGAGKALFEAAQRAASEQGCRALLIESQNINVPACRFYQRMGCSLVSVDEHAYPSLPGEIKLVWEKRLITA